MRATKAGVDNTYAFDAGIPAWAERYPEHTILRGRPLSESTAHWISTEEFQRKCLDWDDFQDLAMQENARVIDARDPVQKGVIDSVTEEQLTPEELQILEEFCQRNDAMLATLGSAHPVIAQPMDQLIKRIVAKGLLQDQTLLIFDQVGKQVRWLMYHLEAAGYTRYHFLSGGAYDVIGLQAYKE
jgi:rhodanese-related sulfurtransferase